MRSESGNLSAGAPQRTRRNIMKMGAIATASTLATVHSASAGQGLICAVVDGINDILGTHLPCPSPKTGGGGGNCFLRGTKILTADGERKIEDLAVGDLLPTKFGGLRPIQWIGRYPIKRSDPSKPWVKDALPVRIARSALAPNVPHSDLYVTGGHSLLIDGVLVPAELLINGTTITRDEAREYDELEYLHVKLESHDVIYAGRRSGRNTDQCPRIRGQFRRLSATIRNGSNGRGTLCPVYSYLGRASGIGVETPQRSLALD